MEAQTLEDASPAFFKRRRGNRLQVLLTGTSRSGKSTLIRQFRLMAQDDFTQSERMHYRSVIHNNVVCGIKAILTAAEVHGYAQGVSEHYQDIRARILHMVDATSLTPSLAESIDSLWRELGPRLDNHFASIIEHETTYSVDSLVFFLKAVRRIAQPDYVPTGEDIMWCRYRDYLSQELSSQSINVGPLELLLHRLDHAWDVPIDAVLFVMSVSDFDPLRHSEPEVRGAVLRAQEQLMELACDERYSSCAFFLVLNKQDLYGCHIFSPHETEPNLLAMKSHMSQEIATIVNALVTQRGSLFVHMHYCSGLSTLDVFEVLSSIKRALAARTDQVDEVDNAENILVKAPTLCGHCERTAAIYECKQCQCSFCSECSSKVHQGRLKRHTIVNFSPFHTQWPRPCPLHHGEQMNMASDLTAEVGCSHCFLTRGPLASHPFVTFDNAWGEVEHKFQFIFREKLRVEATLADRYNVMDTIYHQRTQAIHEVRVRCEEVRQAINRREAELVEVVSQLAFYRRKQVEEDTDELEHTRRLAVEDCSQIPVQREDGPAPLHGLARLKSLEALRCIASRAMPSPEGDSQAGLLTARKSVAVAHKLPSMISRLPSKVDVRPLVAQLAALEIVHEPGDTEPGELCTSQYTEAVAGGEPVEVAASATHAEYEYYYQLKLARALDMSDQEYLGMFHICGEDQKRNRVVQLGGMPLASEVVIEDFFAYLIRSMDEVVNAPYTVVYFHDPCLTRHFNFSMLRKWNALLPRKYFDNLHQVYVVHPSPMVKAGVAVMYPFLNSALWQRMTYLRSLADLNAFVNLRQLCVPDHDLQEALRNIDEASSTKRGQTQDSPDNGAKSADVIKAQETEEPRSGSIGAGATLSS